MQKHNIILTTKNWEPSSPVDVSMFRVRNSPKPQWCCLAV